MNNKLNTFFKQIYRYTRPRSYRHNENIWPFCKIKRDKNGEINCLIYKKKEIFLTKLSNLYNYYNENILLIATGPSINKINFSYIREKILIVGVNGAYYLYNKIKFNFYIIVDMTFFDRKINLIKKIISNQDMIFFTTIHGIIKIINIFGLSKVFCKLSLIENSCYKIYKRSVDFKDIYHKYNKYSYIRFSKSNLNIAFTKNICTGIFDAGTVVYWATQILFFMGFKNLYIAGLDMNNFNKPRFYENKKYFLPSLLYNKINNLIIPAFYLANKIFLKNKRLIINLSLNSYLKSSIIKKVDYREIFKI